MATPPIPLDQMQGAVPDTTPIVAPPGQQASPPSAIQGSINAGQVTQPGDQQQLPPRPIGTGVASQPVSKAEFFRDMLGKFFYAVGTGLANRGSGPDADLRGAGAALTALPQRDIMQQQLAIQKQSAQAAQALKEAQADQYTRVPVTLNGQTMYLPATAAKQILAAQATGQSRENVAQTNVAGKVAVANAAKTAGQVTMTEGIVKSLGLDPSVTGQNLNPAQIKALTPRISNPNLLQLIDKANKGDADAKAILDTKQKMDESLVTARGMAFGKGRLWNLQTVYDPESGETDFATGMDILRAQQQGKNLMPVGKLPQDKIVAVQQLQSEATPALKNFEGAVKAFDNAGDRAIFARVMKGSGEPVRGDESTWLGNVFNQAAKEQLSPEGKLIATQYGPRLAETMGRLRSTLGLQATDQAMGITMRLIPGGSTPDSKVATGQLKQIREMIDQAISIPALRGGGGKGGGSTVDDLAKKYGAKL